MKEYKDTQNPHFRRLIILNLLSESALKSPIIANPPKIRSPGGTCRRFIQRRLSLHGPTQTLTH